VNTAKEKSVISTTDKAVIFNEPLCDGYFDIIKDNIEKSEKRSSTTAVILWFISTIVLVITFLVKYKSDTDIPYGIIAGFVAMTAFTIYAIKTSRKLNCLMIESIEQITKNQKVFDNKNKEGEHDRDQDCKIEEK
jgi:hypothetical protein